MTTKISLSIAAALTLSAALVGAARADTATDRSAAVESVESGLPASLDYENRDVSQHRPTIDELDAAESGNPHSVNYANRDFSSSANWKAQAEAGESGNPHTARPLP